MQRAIAAGLLIFLSVGWARAAEPIRVERDIEYGTVDGVKLQLDIATPTTPGPHPCVVCFHGGAWKAGNKSHLSYQSRYLDVDFGSGKMSLLEWLARQGYVAVTVGYRLAPEHKFPAQIEDAKTAIRFLRKQANRYRLDPDRIAAMGYSAGGHIVALLGTTDPSVGFEGSLYREQSSKVNCVIDFFGPTDLSLYGVSEGLVNTVFKPLMGCRYSEKPDVYKKASPIEHVSKSAPPFLILHGTADILVPIIHSERFHEKLLSAGVKSELKTYSGAGHGWSGDSAKDSMQSVTQFLESNLKAK
jgi:acetyl esterase/lipase